MKLDGVQDRLDVTKADLSGSSVVDANFSGWNLENVNLTGWAITDANLSGWRVSNANLAGLRLSDANLKGVTISACRLDGMTIEGILVSELLSAYHAAQHPSANSPDRLLEKLLSLPKNELEESLAAVNAYLASAAGQKEFGLGPQNVSSTETKV